MQLGMRATEQHIRAKHCDIVVVVGYDEDDSSGGGGDDTICHM